MNADGPVGTRGGTFPATLSPGSMTSFSPIPALPYATSTTRAHRSLPRCACAPQADKNSRSSGRSPPLAQLGISPSPNCPSSPISRRKEHQSGAAHHLLLTPGAGGSFAGSGNFGSPARCHWQQIAGELPVLCLVIPVGHDDRGRVAAVRADVQAAIRLPPRIIV